MNTHTHSRCMPGERCCTELIFQINVSSMDDAMNFDEFSRSRSITELECINFESNWPHNSIHFFFLRFGIFALAESVRSTFWLTHVAAATKRKGPRQMAYKVALYTVHCAVHTQYAFLFNKFQMRVFCFFVVMMIKFIHSFTHSI